MNPKRETIIGCGVFLGIVLILGGSLLAIMIATGGALRFTASGGKDASVLALTGVGVFFVVLGILAVGGSIYYGYATLNREHRLPAVTFPDMVVVARFAINEIGEMVFSDFDPDDPEVKLYVHLKDPSGHNRELRCPWPVWEECGEGMRGVAVVKGDWLGGFKAYQAQP